MRGSEDRRWGLDDVIGDVWLAVACGADVKISDDKGKS